MRINPLFLADFYKLGHVAQYPPGTQQIWSNWTPRSSRVEGVTEVVHFGLGYYIQEYLQDAWDIGFFHRPWCGVMDEYRELCENSLGIPKADVTHLKALWDLGHLPLAIYSLPEGAKVPLGCPALVITNTDPRFYWLPNYIETNLSNILWQASTSATTALRFRRIFEAAARKAGESDLSFVDIQGHDFSYRGLGGTEAAVLSGMGHLLSFSGTDTIPAIEAAREYYGAAKNVGGSVPATEHSVMCAGGQDGEFETFERLITEVYPRGIVSIVSDTWDLWKVLNEYAFKLRDVINSREGKVVFRPDSGDPVKIICGDPQGKTDSERLGAMNCLGRSLINAYDTNLGYMFTGSNKVLLKKAGLIYGDGISPERATAILDGLLRDGWSPYNIVFGIGSYTYQMVTRDTYNFAMKATAVRNKAGEVVPIFKDPVTDNAHKKSHRGIPVVWQDDSGGYFYTEETDPAKLNGSALELVFRDGAHEKHWTFDEIRKRVRG